MEKINSLNLDLQELLNSYHENKRSPCIVLGYSFEGYQHYLSAGKLDRVNFPSSSTKFPIGDLTEIITSFCFLELIKNNPDERLTTMKVPLIKYLPNLKIKEPQFNTRFINIIDLLTHTSGLGDYRQKWDSYGNELEFDELESIKKGVFKELYDKSILEQLFISNSQWYKSPHNFGLISYLIEELQPYSAKKFLLTKLRELNLHQTNFKLEDSATNFLSPYERRKNSFKKLDYKRSIIYTSSGLVSTISDILDFTDLLNEAYNNPNSKYHETSNQMYSETYSPSKFLSKIGIPFVIRSLFPLILEYQSYKKGICSKLIAIPRYKFSMILVSNGDFHSDFENICNKIIKLFYRTLLNINLDRDYELVTQTASKQFKNIVGIYRGNKFSPLNSHYLNSFGNEVSIEVKNNKLVIRSLFKKQPNFFPKLFENQGRELRFLSEKPSSLIFGFSNNNRLIKISFPKSEIPIYCYIESPGPVMLFRIKKENTGFRTFLLSWSKINTFIKTNLVLLILKIKTKILRIPFWIILPFILIKTKLAQQLKLRSEIRTEIDKDITKSIMIQSTSEEIQSPQEIIIAPTEDIVKEIRADEIIEIESKPDKSRSTDLKKKITRLLLVLKIKSIKFLHWSKINIAKFISWIKIKSIVIKNTTKRYFKALSVLLIHYSSVFNNKSKIFLKSSWVYLINAGNKIKDGLTKYYNKTKKVIEVKSPGVKSSINKTYLTLGANLIYSLSTVYKLIETRLPPISQSLSPKIYTIKQNISKRRHQISLNKKIRIVDKMKTPIHRFDFNKNGFQFLWKLHLKNMQLLNNRITQKSELLSTLILRSINKLNSKIKKNAPAGI